MKLISTYTCAWTILRIRTGHTGTNCGLLKDINTTTTGLPSSPTKGVWMGTNYYFAATDGINGVELWKTNGITGNTAMLKISI